MGKCCSKAKSMRTQPPIPRSSPMILPRQEANPTSANHISEFERHLLNLYIHKNKDPVEAKINTKDVVLDAILDKKMSDHPINPHPLDDTSSASSIKRSSSAISMMSIKTEP
jgi:hypothetical protein